MMAERPDGAPKVRGRSATLGHEPALDGLRAIAVAAVLLYHARFGFAAGGFLGVSTFFTLSGFLITTLMLQEWHREGSISLRGFFRRRFRRLLPAAWFTLALVVAMGAFGAWDDSQLRSLRTDVPWALAELVNWHFIFSGRSYGDQFAAPSPVEHFWSLAVEEQFYIVMPLLVVGVLTLGGRAIRRRASRRAADRRSKVRSPVPPPVPAPGDQAPATRDRSPAARALQRRPRTGALAAVLGVLAVGSFVLNGVLASDDWARAYFGTGSRLGELVAGALLACLGIGRLRAASRGGRWLLDLAGVVGLGVSVLLWSRAGVSADWMYPWGFVLSASATVLVVQACLQRGAVARLLSLAPFVALGRISYGVYLLHWPVFLWLTPTRTGWEPWPLFGLRMAVTLVAATAMFHLLETPVRAGRALRSRVPTRVAFPAVASILVATAVVTADLPPETSVAIGDTTAATTAPPAAPMRVLMVGDELAASWGPSARGTGEVPLEVTSAASPGCGAVLAGWVDLGNSTAERDSDRCGSAVDGWVEAATEQRPDVVVVWSALRDVANRRLEPDGEWLAPGTPALDDNAGVQLAELVERLAGVSGAVVLATSPHFRSTVAPPPPAEVRLPTDEAARPAFRAQHLLGIQDPPGTGPPQNEDARIDRWNDLLEGVADTTGATLVDVAAAMRGWPGGEFDPVRRSSDGVGLTDAGVVDLAAAVAEDLAAVEPVLQRPDPVAEVALQVPLPPAPPATPRRTTNGTVDVLVVGESVANGIGGGLTEWSATQPVRVQTYARFGCPTARGGQFRFLRNTETFPAECDWAVDHTRLVNERDPEVVMVLSGIWDVVDRRLPGDDRFRHVGEPPMDRYVLAEMLSSIDLLGSNGASVVVLTYPRFEPGRDQGYTDLPESAPDRLERLNELWAEAVAMRPGVATLVDFRGWLAAQPGGELDPAKRTDGLHFEAGYSRTVADWLGPQLLAIGRDGLPPPPAN